MKKIWHIGQQLVLGISLSMGLIVASLADFSGTVLEIDDESTWEVIFSGKTDFAKLGTSIATGDFNGDNIADLALGTPDENSRRGVNDTGAVSVYFGNSNFESFDEVVTPDGETENLAFYGTEKDEHVADMLVAGDLNGDGIDDLIIVAQKDRNYDQTKIYIVYGNSSLSGNMNSSDANVVLQRDFMHIPALAVGDINADGIDDLVISDHLTSVTGAIPIQIGREIQGVVYVMFGGGDWDATIDLASEADAVITRDNGNEVFQAEGLAVGDINGDGKDDLLMGSPKESNDGLNLEEMGRVYVYYGRNNFPATVNVTTDINIVIQGSRTKEQMGKTLAVGDVNGDGIGDLLIGGPKAWEEDVVSTTGFGKVDIVYGAKNLNAELDLLDDADVTLTLNHNVGKLGFLTGKALLAADINDDNIDDIIVSTPNAFFSNGTNGWVHVIYGDSALPNRIKLDESADIWIQAPKPPRILSSGRLGSTLAVADLDANGSLDLIMGAPEGDLPGKIANGWSIVMLDAAAKGSPYGEAIATLDPISWILTLPAVEVPTLGSFSVVLQLDLTSLQFELTSGSPLTTNISNPATYDLVTGQLMIPSVFVEETSYWLILHGITGTSPIRFTIGDFGEN